MESTTTDSNEPTLADLIDIWQDAAERVLALSRSLTPEQWSAATQCPGWTVGDVVAHVADIEEFVGGTPRPTEQPDWDRLPHVRGPVGQFIELGVDLRRGRPQVDVVEELAAVIPLRRSQLDDVPAGAEVTGLMGSPVPVERFLRVRIFDIWTHEQDIRWAVGDDGGWNSDPAGISFVQMMTALPFVWARGAAAPAGASLQLTVIGPGMHHDAFVVVDEAGKGRRSEPIEEPDVTLELTWAAYAKLCTGRVGPDDAWLADKFALSGDPDLGARLLAGMAITP